MAKPKQQDPAKRAAKAARRKLRRELEASGLVMTPRQGRPRAQLDHATNPAAKRKARDGQRKLDIERGER